MSVEGLKLLYISSYHETLEYNDLNLFSELGINWFSTGIFKDPTSPLKQPSPWRPNLNSTIDYSTLNYFNQLNPHHQRYSRINLTKEFVDLFDVVLISFCFLRQQMIDEVWGACSHKPCLYVTYSQQFDDFELKLQHYKKKGLILVRGSERESTIKNYAGHSAIVRCYVDSNVYKDWKGGKYNVLSFANDFPARINHPNFQCYRYYWKYLMKNLPCELYGNQSKSAGGGGVLDYSIQLEKYKSSNVYFSIGSPPATVTFNFLEAWMTGCPVVTFGEKIGNGKNFRTYEVPHLIDNSVNGFYSDNINEIISSCTYLLNNPEQGKLIGENGRKKCLSLFSKDVVKEDWIYLFRSLGV